MIRARFRPVEVAVFDEIDRGALPAGFQIDIV